MTAIHQMLGDEIVVARPRIEEADYHHDVFVSWLRGWATGFELCNRKEEPDDFLRTVNEQLHQEERLGYHYVTIYDLIRRLRDSGG